jgi:hypothetical protein
MKAKYFKKIIAVSAVMVIAAVAAGCQLETGSKTWNVGHRNDSANVIATLCEGTLTISGTGRMTDYKCQTPWDKFRESITKVIIEEGVTEIGINAFYGSTGLTSVIIGNSVTSIEYRAFRNSPNLTNIEVDSGNTVYASVDGVLFDKNKERLILYPYGRQGTYRIPNNVISIKDEAFQSSAGLTFVIIPGSVTSIGKRVFQHCTGLKSINVENDNSVYSSIDGVLFNKNRDTLIFYPEGKQRSIRSRGGWAVKRDEYRIPDGVTSIGDNAFIYCPGLTSLIIPGSVTSIGWTAFYNCIGINLTSITALPPTPPLIGRNAFFRVDETTACLYVPEENIDAYRLADGWKDFACIREISGQ